MKKLFIILVIALTLNSCDKDNDNPPPTNPVDQLPPPTQIGANKVGCLLDGKVFLPDNAQNSKICFYQLVNGEYFFALGFNKRDTNYNLIAINIGTNSKQIFQGEEYQLVEYLPNNASAAYIYNLNENFTSLNYTGKLVITKLDFTKNIVSGTFWFDVKDSDGIIHQIREGRFDMQFTQ